MTPEEAQRKTEEKWKTIAVVSAGGARPQIGGYCGWCTFGKAIKKYPCGACPVLRVHGESCGRLIVLRGFLAAYDSDEWADEARAVYEFLCQMGPQYIAAAHKILEEKEHEA